MSPDEPPQALTETSARIACPKCRHLGLPSDCADQLHHEDRTPTGENVTPTPDGSDDGKYWLEVTVRYDVPVTSTLDLDPHQMATHMREEWMDDAEQLLDVTKTALEYEYDVTVRPVFES